MSTEQTNTPTIERDITQAPLAHEAPLASERETLNAAWNEFRSRVQVKASDGKRESSVIDTSKLTEEQRQDWDERGKLPRPTQEQESAEPAEAKSETEGEAKAEAERAEQKQPPPQNLTPQQTQQVAKDRFFQKAAQDPNYDAIVGRATEPFFPNTPDGHGRMGIFSQALREIPNGDDVIYFLCHPDNNSVGLNMQTSEPWKIAQAIHLISAELRFGKPKAKRAVEEPKPRAPKPVSEVGGRGAGPVDHAVSAAKSGNFKAFSREMEYRYRNGG